MSQQGTLFHGQKLNNRYVILEPAGEGGMASVYKARDTVLNRNVAVKVMRIDPSKEPEVQEATRQAFQAEISILENLSKLPDFPSGLPKYYDSFHDDVHDCSYLVMQFIEGKTLKDMMAEAPYPHQLSEDKMLRYALQICDILIFLHKQPSPIIFRDIKPSNIMIDSRYDTAYLIDFGIARYYKEGQQVDTFLFCSPGYAPPELIDRDQTEIRSDLFSLGVTLHHCLTGILPAGPDNRTSWLKFEPVINFNPRVSIAMNNLIMRLIAIRKEDRPANAQEVKQRLEDILRGEVITATVPVYSDDTIVETARIFLSFSQWNSFHGILKVVTDRLLLVAAGLGAVLIVSGRSVGVWLFNAVKQGIPILFMWMVSLGRWLLTTFAQAQQAVQANAARRAQQANNQNTPYAPNNGNNGNNNAPSRAGSIVRVVFAQAATITHTVSVRVASWSLYVVLLAGLIAGMSVWSVGSLTLLHAPPHLVLFLLSLLLCLLALLTYLRPRTHKKETSGTLLAFVILGSALATLSLLSLPDVQSVIRNAIVYQIIANMFPPVLLVLTIAALFRRDESMSWIDHTAMLLLSVWSIVLIAALGFPALQEFRASFSMSSDVARSIVIWSIALPALVGGISLLRMPAKFSRFDAFLVLLLAAPLLVLQFAVGTQALAVLNGVTHGNTAWLNNGLVIIAGVVSVLACKFFAQSLFLRRLPLLLLTLSTISLQQFVSRHTQLLAQPKLPKMNILFLQPFIPAHNGTLLLIGLVVLGIFTFLSMIQGGIFVLTDRIVLICTGLFCLFVVSAYRANVPSFVQPNLEARLLSATQIGVEIALPLVALLTLLHALHPLGLGPLIRLLEGLLRMGGRILQILYALITLLVLVFHINSYAWARTMDWIHSGFVGGSLQSPPLAITLVYQLLFLCVALLTGVAVIRFIIALLKSPDTSASSSRAIGSQWRTRLQMGQKPSYMMFDGLDYILILGILASLFWVMLWNTLGQHTSSLSIVTVFMVTQLSLKTGVVGLLLVSAMSLLWLGRNLARPIYHILNVLLPSAFICLLIAFLGTFLLWLQPLFLAVTLSGLLLLIGGVFLASFAETVV